MRKPTLALLLVLGLVIYLSSSAYAVQWKQIQTQDVAVYYQKQPLGERALQASEDELKRLSQFFRYKPVERIKIYVYGDPAAFRLIAPGRRAMGLARPFSNEIAVLATEDLYATISHELVHVIFLQSLPSLRDLPFWFVEGIAFYLSQPQLTQVDLEGYALRGDIGHLEELSTDLAPEAEAKAAAEGYLITRFLGEKFGREKLREMVFSMQKGTPFYQALEKATGLTEKTLDEEWHQYGEKQKSFFFLRELRLSGLLIIGLLSVLVSAYWLIRIRKRLSVEEDMEEEEGASPEESVGEISQGEGGDRSKS